MLAIAECGDRQPTRLLVVVVAYTYKFCISVILIYLEKHTPQNHCAVFTEGRFNNFRIVFSAGRLRTNGYRCATPTNGVCTGARLRAGVSAWAALWPQSDDPRTRRKSWGWRRTQEGRATSQLSWSSPTRPARACSKSPARNSVSTFLTMCPDTSQLNITTWVCSEGGGNKELSRHFLPMKTHYQCLLFPACGTHTPSVDNVAGRLANGDGAASGELPWMAILYHSRLKTSCTASIISPSWLLASYNCLRSR